MVLKTSKFDVLNVIRYSRKLLPSAIRIDRFLDIRTVKIQARNYVVVTPLHLYNKHPLFTCCDQSFFSDIHLFVRVYSMISGVHMHYAPCWFPDFVV